MNAIRKLTIHSDLDGFFRRMKRGDVFTYSDGFDLETVFSLAHDQDCMVQYCDPSTLEYRRHGCNTCRVTWVKRHGLLRADKRWYRESA